MSQPWKTAGPAGFDFGSHLGQLCFLIVAGVHPPRPTQFGVRSGVRCTIVFLDGPNPGEELNSVLLWGQRIVARLRNCVGQILLHRLVEGQGQGANKPNDLADPTEADARMALGWVNFYPGRIEQLLRDAVQDFEVQEAALLAQERSQSQGGAARPQAQPQYQQPAQPTPAWQLNNQHQPVPPQQYQQQAQPQYAQPQQPAPAQQWQQPAQAAPPPPAPPGWAQQPPSAAPPTQAVYNGPPPAQPPPQQQPAPAQQQPAQQGPPWQSAVVPGGVPASAQEAGY